MDKFQKAKLLIGGQAIDDNLLVFYFDVIEQRVMNFCHIPLIPPALEHIIIQMVVGYWELMHPPEGAVTAGKEITSIKRGDTTITYGAGGSTAKGGASLASIDAFVSGYYQQLYPFRRLVSPS